MREGEGGRETDDGSGEEKRGEGLGEYVEELKEKYGKPDGKEQEEQIETKQQEDHGEGQIERDYQDTEKEPIDERSNASSSREDGKKDRGTAKVEAETQAEGGEASVQDEGEGGEVDDAQLENYVQHLKEKYHLEDEGEIDQSSEEIQKSANAEPDEKSGEANELDATRDEARASDGGEDEGNDQNQSDNSSKASQIRPETAQEDQSDIERLEEVKEPDQSESKLDDERNDQEESSQEEIREEYASAEKQDGILLGQENDNFENFGDTATETHRSSETPGVNEQRSELSTDEQESRLAQEPMQRIDSESVDAVDSGEEPRVSSEAGQAEEETRAHVLNGTPDAHFEAPGDFRTGSNFQNEGSLAGERNQTPEPHVSEAADDPKVGDESIESARQDGKNVPDENLEANSGAEEIEVANKIDEGNERPGGRRQTESGDELSMNTQAGTPDSVEDTNAAERSFRVREPQEFKQGENAPTGGGKTASDNIPRASQEATRESPDNVTNGNQKASDDSQDFPQHSSEWMQLTSRVRKAEGTENQQLAESLRGRDETDIRDGVYRKDGNLGELHDGVNAISRVTTTAETKLASKSRRAADEPESLGAGSNQRDSVRDTAQIDENQVSIINVRIGSDRSSGGGKDAVEVKPDTAIDAKEAENSRIHAVNRSIQPSEELSHGNKPTTTSDDNLDRKESGTETHVAVIDSRVWSYKRIMEQGAYFALAKRDIEEQLPTRLEKGVTYTIDGKIDEIYEFHVKHQITASRYIRLYVPKERTPEVRQGQLYHISISSIERVRDEGTSRKKGESPSDSLKRLGRSEIGGIPRIDSSARGEGAVPTKCTAYKGPHSEYGTRFSLWKPCIERETGVQFEQGKTYEISGRIENICEFKARHSESGYNNYFPFTVPREYATKVIPGEKYRIFIDSVKEREPEPIVESRANEEWDWKMVAAWVDTEGSYITHEGTSCRAVICQKERQPLEGICRFLEGEGIPCYIIKTRGDNHILGTKGGPEVTAKFILRTEPYIRTSNKREQIAKFREYISRTRKHESYRRKRARKILGLEAKEI